jgi:serine/threonine protein kinase
MRIKLTLTREAAEVVRRLYEEGELAEAGVVGLTEIEEVEAKQTETSSTELGTTEEAASRQRGEAAAIAGEEAVRIEPLTFPGCDQPELLTCTANSNIYEATQISMRRPVCIKCLGTGKDSAFSRLLAKSLQTAAADALASKGSRFAREVEITALLSESRYVPIVYDRGTAALTVCDAEGQETRTDGWPYFVMEWIEGCQLGEFLTRDEGPWGGACRAAESRQRLFHQLPGKQQAVLLKLFQEVACGLRAAHQEGIAHLDVSHRNVLVVDEPGNNVRGVRIIDWGHARRLGPEDVERLRDTPAKGLSADYAAPEQVRTAAGEAGGPVGCRADVYALGGIGYYLLTGKAPRQGNDQEMREQALCPKHHAALDQELRKSGAPRFWVDLIAQCLSALPGKRPATAAEVADGIEKHIAGLERRKKIIERFLTASLVFGLLLALIAVSVYYVKEKQLGEQSRTAAAEAKRLAELSSKRSELHQMLTAAYGYWYDGERQKARESAAHALRRIEALAADNPDDYESTLLLAFAHAVVGKIHAPGKEAIAANIASAVLRRGPPVEEKVRQELERALTYCDRAVEIIARLDQWADLPEKDTSRLRDLRAGVEEQRCNILAQLGRFSEALVACDLAIALEANPLRSQEMEIVRRGLLLWAASEQSTLPWSPPVPDRAKRLMLSAHLADAPGVSDAAVYNAACAHAAAAKDSETAEEKERLARRAVEYLERIRANGYFATEVKRRELRDDPNLASLHGRPDYDALCRRAEGKP